jgi:hypothetical protein
MRIALLSLIAAALAAAAGGGIYSASQPASHQVTSPLVQYSVRK